MRTKCRRFRFPFWPDRLEVGPCRTPLSGEERHALEREQFVAVLQSFKATRISDRLTILDIFLSIEQHVTLSELEGLIRQQRPESFERAFVQETMEMFCQFGFAQKISFENLETRYEHHHLGLHHDHFICTRCGQIQEFANDDLERIQRAIAKEFQFHPLQHKMEIYGLCAECMAQRDDTIPLRLAANGERVEIVQLLGDRAMQARLVDMGLTVGSCVDVINNHPAGPFIVAVHKSRLAINAEIAQHIVVAHVCRHHDL